MNLPSSRRRPHSKRERGGALIEFAFLLPIFVVLSLVLANLSLLLDDQMSLIHLSREAAGVLARGAEIQETIDAIVAADGDLDLDQVGGRIILTQITTDSDGDPVIIAQRSAGGLNRSSSVGTLPVGAPSAPAMIPNGRTLPGGSLLVVVELFASQDHFLGTLPIAPGQGQIVLTSRASF
jgi:Flp pilus assembly protein TadG